MERKFLENYCNFCIDNFEFNPSTLKPQKNILSSTKTFSFQKSQIQTLNFPENQDLSNIFLYQSLILLLKSSESFKTNNKKLIRDILSYIYEYYEGSLDIIEIFNSMEYSFPFEFSEKFEKFFKNIHEFHSFLVFNYILLIYKEIPEEYFKSSDFVILDILILYDYIFIYNSIDNYEIKSFISKLIILFIEGNINFPQQDNSAIFLNGFFFEQSNISEKNFLVPIQIYNNGCKEFNCLIDIILKTIKNQENIFDNIDKSILDNLKNIKRKKFVMDDNDNKNINEDESKEINELKNIISELKENIMQIDEEKKMLENKMIKIIEKNKVENNIKFNKQTELINSQSRKIEKLNQNMNNQCQIILELTIMKETLDRDLIKLKAKNEIYDISIKKLKETIENQNHLINELNKKILEKESKDYNINKKIILQESVLNNKEEQIQKVEKEKVPKNKIIKRDISHPINKSLINIDCQNTILSQNSQLISQLQVDINYLNQLKIKNDEEINKLMVGSDLLKKDKKENANLIELIDNRYFFQKIYFDFCFYFDIESNDNYIETTNLIVEQIKNSSNNEIKEFDKKVNLIEFINYLGNFLDKVNSIKPELLSNYKEENNAINIKIEMNKMNKCFNEYSKKDFNLLFSFLMKDYNFNQNEINNMNNNNEKDKKYFFNAIKKYLCK